MQTTALKLNFNNDNTFLLWGENEILSYLGIFKAQNSPVYKGMPKTHMTSYGFVLHVAISQRVQFLIPQFEGGAYTLEGGGLTPWRTLCPSTNTIFIIAITFLPKIAQ